MLRIIPFAIVPAVVIGNCSVFKGGLDLKDKASLREALLSLALAGFGVAMLVAGMKMSFQ